MKLSVVINTKNAATSLAATLDSVQFADEIVVVDMHSVDKTEQIAKQYQAKFLLHDDIGYVEPARNFAIEQASHEMILVLDSDEVLSPALKQKIMIILNQKDAADVYLIPRKNLVFGSWPQHTGWWPDYQARLFKKGQVIWSSIIHQQPTIKGRIVKLPAEERFALIHHHYPTVHSYLERLNRYTSIQAENSVKGFSQDVSSSKLISAFFNEFFRRFFVFSGYKDEVVGVGLSFLQASYELAVQLKQWEMKSGEVNSESDRQVITALEKSRGDLNYWLADWRVKNSTGLSQMYWRIRRKFRW